MEMDELKVYMSYLMDVDKLDDYKALSKGEIKQQLLKDFADWSPELKNISSMPVMICYLDEFTNYQSVLLGK